MEGEVEKSDSELRATEAILCIFVRATKQYNV